jgi:polyhydroxybutyrate depolymerase
VRSPGARVWRAAIAAISVCALASACGQGGSNSASSTIAGKPKASGSAESASSRPSPGCSSKGRGQELTLERRNVEVGGRTRWYLISTPPPERSEKPLGMVVDFHGLAEGAQLEAVTTQFGPLAQRDGFVAVFPQGTGNPVHWDSGSTKNNADLTFVSDMLDQIEATECVDESRIYATGFSDGAIMTSLLACTMSNRFAAFAPVSGVQLESPCAASRPVPIIAFHGTADPILYFNGGVGSEVLNHALGGGPAPHVKIPPANLNGSGYPAAVAGWAKRDGCGPDPKDTQFSAHVIQRVYACPQKVAVEFYIIVGGGHSWPGSAFSESIASITGPTTFEVNATSVIWAFFQRFQI